MAESNSTGRVVGIDLGTTNSLVAYMQGDAPVVIPGVGRLNLVPSVVALDPIPADGGRPTVTVGNTARKALIETPERVIYSVKRLMGRGLEEIQDELKLFPFRLADDIEAGEVPRIQLGELRFTPPEISAYILRQLKRNAERFFGAPVTQAVITVPAYFNDAQRQATKDAGRMAGLEVLRLVNEPTAAALAYGLDRAKAGTIAVYDLGGGTFDISILKLRDGIFEVQSTNGDTHLGGDDIDNLLLAIALDEIHAEHGVDLRGHPGAVQAVRKAAIEAKITLSTEAGGALRHRAAQRRSLSARDSARGLRAADRAGAGAHRRPMQAGARRCRHHARTDRRSGAGGRLDAHSRCARAGGRALPSEPRAARSRTSN